MLNEIISNIENKKIVFTVFLDFKKAFDSINHVNLVNKLQTNFNYSYDACKLILSYLSHRSQFVTVNGIQSEVKPIKYGVPQGSILGPILFNMFINDISSFINDCTLFQYADDTVLILSSEDVVNGAERLNCQLDLISDYCVTNQLFLNELKCKDWV